MDTAQQTLSRLIQLAHAEQEAIASQDRKRMDKIDREIEHALGEKQRAMGALHQHRDRHGC